MATCSSILAWQIPWTAEPGGLQSMGSQRVGHHWVHTHTLKAPWTTDEEKRATDRWRASWGPSRQQVEECGRLFLQRSSRDSKQLSHCYREQWLYNAESCVTDVPLTEHPPCARSASSFFTSIIYFSGKLIFMECYLQLHVGDLL